MALMAQKSIYDTDGDGIVTEKEISLQERIFELEAKESKSETQKRMARVAMWSMIIFTIVLFTPLMSDSRVSALGDLLGLFYIAQASIVGAYMGFTSWMSKK